MKKSIVVGVLVISLLIISLSFVSASWMSDLLVKVTGNVVNKIKLERTCIDSDNGDNRFVKGIVTYSLNGRAREFTDICRNKKLVEYTCAKNNNVDSKMYRCENGCTDGACISLAPPEPACKDGDGGKKYNVKGTATTAEESKTDSCFGGYAGGIFVAEYYCDNGVIAQEDYQCPENCVDGACVASTK